MSRIAGLLRRTFGLVREHVGTDHLGNKYYLIPEQKTWTGKLSLVLVLARLNYCTFSIPVTNIALKVGIQN